MNPFEVRLRRDRARRATTGAAGGRNPSAEGLILAREQPQPLRGRHRPFVEVHRRTIASMSSIDDGDQKREGGYWSRGT